MNKKRLWLFLLSSLLFLLPNSMSYANTYMARMFRDRHKKALQTTSLEMVKLGGVWNCTTESIIDESIEPLKHEINFKTIWETPYILFNQTTNVPSWMPRWFSDEIGFGSYVIITNSFISQWTGQICENNFWNCIEQIHGYPSSNDFDQIVTSVRKYRLSKNVYLTMEWNTSSDLLISIPLNETFANLGYHPFAYSSCTHSSNNNYETNSISF